MRKGLTDALKQTKDIFVLGSTVGRDFLICFSITFNNIERVGIAATYAVKIIKTETVTRIKLLVNTFGHHWEIQLQKGKKEKPFCRQYPKKNQFNKNLKEYFAEKAGWTHFVDKKEAGERGKEMDVPKRSTSVLVLTSPSHVMRQRCKFCNAQ